MKTLLSAWAEFSENILPQTGVEAELAKTIFYAGAAAVLLNLDTSPLTYAEMVKDCHIFADAEGMTHSVTNH